MAKKKNFGQKMAEVKKEKVKTETALAKLPSMVTIPREQIKEFFGDENRCVVVLKDGSRLVFNKNA